MHAAAVERGKLIVHDAPHEVLLARLQPLLGAGADHHRVVRCRTFPAPLVTSRHADPGIAGAISTAAGAQACCNFAGPAVFSICGRVHVGGVGVWAAVNAGTLSATSTGASGLRFTLRLQWVWPVRPL